MNSIPDTDVQPGQLLAGKFRIERVLGRGGMGVVVAATHVQLEERVALKFLLPEALQNKEAVRRFEREARAAVKIKSEHVARVTDVGTLETGAPYMVMEFLNGMDLGDYLEQKGQLDIEEATDLLLQACEAIAEAHSLGIVHRDLKPANLFRIIRSDGSPSVKVLDFGISKVSSGSDASMTQTSSMMGSPYYMSPEQMTSAKNVDHRTDIWALGIILHELLTGKVPYQGETIPEICAQVLQSPPPRLTSLRPEAPVELEQIIDMALAKNRDDRFPDVASFAAAIAEFGNQYSHRHVERISKVLGVAPTMRGSYPDGVVGMRTGTHATGAHATMPLRPSGAHHGTDEDVSRKATTLGGAAHTQLDYSPPTTKSKVPLIAAAAAILIGAGGWAALRGATSDETTDPEGVVAVSAAEEDRNEAEKAEVEVAKPVEEKPAEEKKAPEPEKPVEPEKVVAPAPKAAPVPAPRPAPVTAAPRPAAQPSPAPRPKPAIAPQPKPAPKPSTSSLYLDRK